MKNNKFKINKIEPLKKKSWFKIRYVFYLALAIWVVVGTMAIYVIVRNYILEHDFRSPLIIQSPVINKEIKTPVASKSAVLRVHVFAEEKSEEEAVLYTTESVTDRIARATVENFGHRHVDDMLELVFRESSFNPLAQNRNSTAYGLFQFLDQSWGNYGCVKTDDVDEQIRCGIAYVKARYQNPTNALSFHSERGFY